MRTTLVIILMFVFVSKNNCQNSQASFNSFKDFKLGMSKEALLKLHPEIVNDSIKFDWHFPYHSEIQYDYMNGFQIDKFEMSSGNKINLKLGIYKDRLALIELEYGIFQSFNELLDALVSKYGKALKVESGQYYDILKGSYVNATNIYWKSQNYTLNLSGKDGSQVRIIYSDDLIQKEIKSRKSEESLNNIQ
jgi:hypothetical protein